MKNLLVAGLLVIGSISATFAGGTWAGGVIPSSVAVENTMDNGPILMLQLGTTTYVMPLDTKASGAILDRQNFMISIAKAAVESARPLYVWYTASTNTVTWKDLTGSSYTNIKIDGVSFK